MWLGNHSLQLAREITYVGESILTFKTVPMCLTQDLVTLSNYYNYWSSSQKDGRCVEFCTRISILVILS